MDIRENEDRVIENVDSAGRKSRTPEQEAKRIAALKAYHERRRAEKEAAKVQSDNAEEPKKVSYQDKKDAEKKAKAASKESMEKGYQRTVRMQISQIKELNEAVNAMAEDVMTLKAEREELLQGLRTVRSSIDRLHKLLHEGETQ